MYPLQWDGSTPLHFAAIEGHTTCVEHFLSTPGIDVNIQNMVSWCINDDKSGAKYYSVYVKNKTIECPLISPSPQPRECKCYTLLMLYMKGHVDDHVLHLYMYMCTLYPTMWTELLYLLQYKDTPLHNAAKEGHTACVEHLLSTPGIDVNIKSKVSWSTE